MKKGENWKGGIEVIYGLFRVKFFKELVIYGYFNFFEVY